ncbi:hypothetical protein AOC36_00955 [Erysipelothrix larvae]|uniref:Uncharacterized protein n=1 Tax=Erysipelothrix larvae TaxID=1514105 RepID=A0A120JTE2_9FIRM|nr:hypothetical protein [Erysipelothrix larvae]AMC92611.1 hypothetical protein AOC36_00955 [Erysipelothrix larvae]
MKAFEGDLDFSSADNKLELLAETLTWVYRATKAAEMRKKNTGSGIVYDFNHYINRLTIINQKGPDPF